MSIAKRFALIIVVLVGCVGCDQTTKSIAQSYLSSAEAWSFLGDTVRLQLTHNAGAFLGLGSSMPEFWRHAIFSLGGIAVLFGLLVYALLSKHLQPAGVFAIALYFAGGVSNVIDRWAYDGYVVDFINVGIGSIRTGIFNFADMFILLGGIIFLASEFHRKGFLTIRSKWTR